MSNQGGSGQNPAPTVLTSHLVTDAQPFSASMVNTYIHGGRIFHSAPTVPNSSQLITIAANMQPFSASQSASGISDSLIFGLLSDPESGNYSGPSIIQTPWDPPLFI